jgi:hypothetical protein
VEHADRFGEAMFLTVERGRALSGAIKLDRCEFVECNLVNISFAATKEQLSEMKNGFVVLGLEE